jgi:hypothetical protein
MSMTIAPPEARHGNIIWGHRYYYPILWLQMGSWREVDVDRYWDVKLFPNQLWVNEPRKFD